MSEILPVGLFIFIMQTNNLFCIAYRVYVFLYVNVLYCYFRFSYLNGILGSSVLYKLNIQAVIKYRHQRKDPQPEEGNKLERVEGDNLFNRRPRLKTGYTRSLP